MGKHATSSGSSPASAGVGRSTSSPRHVKLRIAPPREGSSDSCADWQRSTMTPVSLITPFNARKSADYRLLGHQLLRRYRRRVASRPQILNFLEGASLGFRNIEVHERRRHEAHGPVDPIREAMIEHGVQCRIADEYFERPGDEQIGNPTRRHGKCHGLALYGIREHFR